MLDERIAQIREWFEDDLSRRVFDARLDCGADIKREAFPETLEFSGLGRESKERLLRFVQAIRDSQREKFIYGAGIGCRSILERECMRALGVIGWSGIIDNNVIGERYGLPIISFTEFSAKYKDALVLNSVGQPAGFAIHRQCIDIGIECVSLFELDMSWNQYFDLPKELGMVEDGEVFVHAGCYNGDTQRSYINWFGDTYAKMVTFEPSAEQFALSKERLAGLREVELVQAGLSDKEGTVSFDLDIPGRSFISKTGSEKIHVVDLDGYMRGQRVTFIALDIEGEEVAALRGAEQIIRAQKPKLAISVYHKPEDIWELPTLIKRYNPDYKFYMRHYHLLDMAETILYAF